MSNFDQREQHIHGDQYNAGHDININEMEAMNKTMNNTLQAHQAKQTRLKWLGMQVVLIAFSGVFALAGLVMAFVFGNLLPLFLTIWFILHVCFFLYNIKRLRK